MTISSKITSEQDLQNLTSAELRRYLLENDVIVPSNTRKNTYLLARAMAIFHNKKSFAAPSVSSAQRPLSNPAEMTVVSLRDYLKSHNVNTKGLRKAAMVNLAQELMNKEKPITFLKSPIPRRMERTLRSQKPDASLSFGKSSAESVEQLLQEEEARLDSTIPSESELFENLDQEVVAKLKKHRSSKRKASEFDKHKIKKLLFPEEPPAPIKKNKSKLLLLLPPVFFLFGLLFFLVGEKKCTGALTEFNGDCLENNQDTTDLVDSGYRVAHFVRTKTGEAVCKSENKEFDKVAVFSEVLSGRTITGLEAFLQRHQKFFKIEFDGTVFTTAFPFTAYGCYFRRAGFALRQIVERALFLVFQQTTMLISKYSVFFLAAFFVAVLLLYIRFRVERMQEHEEEVRALVSWIKKYVAECEEDGIPLEFLRNAAESARGETVPPGLWDQALCRVCTDRRFVKTVVSVEDEEWTEGLRMASFSSQDRSHSLSHTNILTPTRKRRPRY